MSALLSSQLENWRITAGTIARAMSPAGLYWTESIVLPQARYLNRADLIFIACSFDEDHSTMTSTLILMILE
jgi:hypothetical protein